MTHAAITGATRKQTRRDLGRARLGRRLWKLRYLYLMLLPTIVFAILVQYRPYVWIQMAFRDFSFVTFAEEGMRANPWAGLKYVQQFVGGSDFWRVIRNTLAINGLTLLIGFPMPIIFALMLNELWFKRYKKVVQTVTYLPHFISWVVVAGLFYLLLDQTTGSVNDLIEWLGMKRIPFFRRADLFWPIIIGASIWKEVGWGSIIYLAALTSIDPQLYEAARIDGANKWQEIFNITLPGLFPTISVLLILTTGRIVVGGGIIPNFEALYNMGNPMVSDTAETIAIHVYYQGILLGRYSYSTAVGVFQSLVAFILVFGSNYLSKRMRGYGVV